MTRFTMQRAFDAPASVVWDVVADHELYGEAAPNLASVAVLEGEGETMVRRCVDTDGNEWTESCTRWEEGEGFAVAVDVGNSAFHRRLFARFEGEWRLEERAEDVLVTIAFEFEPRFGPFGALVSKYLAYRAPVLVEPIFDRWAAEIRSRTGTAAAVQQREGGAGGRR